MKRARTVLLWLITLLMAFAMVGSGIQKFTSPAWERMFRAWGYPDHFYLVIGVVETVAGLGLLVPRLASACGTTLAVVMLAAAATQITRGGRNGVGELVFATLLGIIAYGRWPGVLARSSAQPGAGIRDPLVLNSTPIGRTRIGSRTPDHGILQAECEDDG